MSEFNQIKVRKKSKLMMINITNDLFCLFSKVVASLSLLKVADWPVWLSG